MADVIVYCSGSQTTMTSTLKSYATTKGFTNSEIALDASLKSNIDALVASGNRIAAIFVVGDVIGTAQLGWLRNVLDAGYPIIISEQSSGSIVATTSPTFNFGLTLSNTDESEVNTGDTLYITANNDIFSESAGLNAATSLKFADGSSWRLLTTVANVHSSATILGKITNSAGLVTCAYVPKGANTAKITNIGATFILAGFFYGSVNTLGCKIFIDLVNLCLRQYVSYTINGIVENTEGDPLERTVRLYNRSSGALVSSTTSATDGTYLFTISNAGEFYVVCMADEADTFKSQIHDKVEF